MSNHNEGIAAREEGMERSEAAVCPEWRAAAERVLDNLIRSGEPFTTDDIIDSVGEPSYGDKRGLGGMMMSRARAGDIVATGYYVTSSNPSCHARPKKQWVGAEKRKQA